MGLLSWAMAKVYDRVLAGTEEACLRQWRSELLADVGGRVLEVGAGTGANLDLYGPGVEHLVITEYDRNMLDKLQSKPRPPGAELMQASLESLPFEDRSFDVVVGTLVMCSVPDLQQAISEVHRVLAPGGRYVFIEHVAARDNPKRLRLQQRVEPFWRYFTGNCHLTRRTGDAIEAQGFHVRHPTHESMRKAIAWTRPSVRGVAVKSG